MPADLDDSTRILSDGIPHYLETTPSFNFDEEITLVRPNPLPRRRRSPQRAWREDIESAKTRVWVRCYAAR